MKLSGEDMFSYLAILVIVISLASIGMQFTGNVTHDAVVNVTVSESAAINFTVALVNFASGSVTDGAAGATLETGVDSATADGSWSGTQDALTLQNIGNVNVTLGFMASDVAADYLGGTSPTFKYKVTNGASDAGACVSNGASDWTEFTTSNAVACSPLQYEDSADEIDVDIQIYIPSDSNTGEQTATITATGTA